MFGKMTRLAVFAAGLLWCGSLQAAEITLKISHYLPPAHGFQSDCL